jgi:hypothetical protein
MRAFAAVLVALTVLAAPRPATAESALGQPVTIDCALWRGESIDPDEVFPDATPFVFESFSTTVSAAVEAQELDPWLWFVDVGATTISMRTNAQRTYVDETLDGGRTCIRIHITPPPNLVVADPTLIATDVDGLTQDNVFLIDGVIHVALDTVSTDILDTIDIDFTFAPDWAITTSEDPAAWAAATDQTVVEDYEGVANGAYDDAFMDSLYGETRYTTFRFDGLHQIFQGWYNASTTSFTLEFDQHSLAADGGVHAVLLRYLAFSDEWAATVTFANGIARVYPLAEQDGDDDYFAIISNAPIASINVGDGVSPDEGAPAAIFLETLTVGSLPPAPACDGDVNGDGATDIFDFADLADNFGAGPGATRSMGDLNGDGYVDIFDFADLADDFGCGL